jgi:hypothetical protein
MNVLLWCCNSLALGSVILVAGFAGFVFSRSFARASSAGAALGVALGFYACSAACLAAIRR